MAELQEQCQESDKMSAEYALVMEFQKDIATAILDIKIVVEFVIYLKIVYQHIVKRAQ